MYFGMTHLMALIPEPTSTRLWNIATDNHDRFLVAQGSSHNHQAWEGGYFDHIREVMNIAVVMYEAFRPLRALPFKLSDVLIVLYVHDIEKPWKDEHKLEKSERHAFRMATLDQYGVQLTDEQHNAFRYVEGEGNDYSGKHRVMNPLAAFCHTCDVISARVWFDHPAVTDETWGRRWYGG